MVIILFASHFLMYPCFDRLVSKITSSFPLFPSQGIDLVAGGKSKKTFRTKPKSDDVYLKLIFKVKSSLLHCYFFICFRFSAKMWSKMACNFNSVVIQFSGKEDAKFL